MSAILLPLRTETGTCPPYGRLTDFEEEIPVTSTETLTGERADLIATLDKHRGFLRHTVRGLTDEQATLRTTPSELTLAGIIKHVAHTEATWADFAQRGAAAFTGRTWSVEAWRRQWELEPGESLTDVLERYEEVGRRTDEIVATLPDLDAAYPLPPAPWFEKGAVWSARRALLHLIAETSQHAGHADIIRESLDGQKTMG
jgi:Protein of unknown function (DUF664)